MRLTATLPALLALLAAPAHADPDESVYSCNKAPATVTVTFKPEVEVKELVTWAMGFTCKDFLYEPRFVTGRKITVIAPSQMSPHDAYDLFEASLATMGLAVVKKGKTFAIIEAQAAKKEAIPLVKDVDGGESLVRIVVRPTYAKPETIKAAFDPLRSDAGDIQLVGAVVLVTDYASHVKQMTALAKLVDVPGGSEGIYTVPVDHADATKLAAKLEQILGPTSPAPRVTDTGGAAPPAARVFVDERTNTLVLAGSEAGFQRVQALVQRLDIPLDIEGGATIHVYQLGNAIAEEVAKTLNDAIAKTTQSVAATPATTAGAKGAPATTTDQIQLTGQAHVIADKSTNKLIVTATGHDYLAIQEVIRQLDEPRRQVYIETVVLEVEDQDTVEAGTSSHGGIPTDNGSSLVLGGVQTSSVSTLDLKDSLAAVSGLVTGVVGGPLSSSQTFLGTSIPSYAVLFQALATTSHTTFISTPSIIALDNEDSKFHAGTNIPYKRGIIPISSTNPSSLTTTNIDRQPLNFELDIKPHVSAGDNVLLEIKNDANDLGSSDPELGPTWTTRGFETRVVVHDQATVVLTGIAQEREIVTDTKVPLLGDIPVLGYLFKYKSTIKKRSNLLIMLTPYIVKDQLDLQAIQQRKLREHQEFEQSKFSLAHAAYAPHVDYARKRGVVEEINRVVTSVENETAARGELHAPAHVVGGPLP